MQANNNFMIQKLSNNFLVNYPYALIDSFSWKNMAEMNNDGFLLIYICRKRKLTQNISDNAWLTKTKMTALVDYWSYCHSRSSFVLVWLRCFEAFTNIVKYHKPLLISLNNTSDRIACKLKWCIIIVNRRYRCMVIFQT